MDGRNNLPSLSAAVGGLAEFSCQDRTTESRLYYQGMSVQALNSPCSTYCSQSNANQNNAHPVNPLSEFRAASLTQVAPDSFDESDPTVISESIHDEYLPWNPDKESIDDELFPTLGNYLCNQSCLSENEPDIREPTPSNRLNLNHHLTNLPAELAYPQDSRPVAVVNPLKLQQATSESPVNSAKIVTDKSSRAERNRESEKQRYRNDPAYAERKKERQKQRYRNDPAYADSRREKQRERLRACRKNPVYTKRERERLKNPAHAERRREQQRKRHRERYQNDPTYAEHRREQQRKRHRERYQNDPVYAKGRRVYTNIYNQMKKKVGKEEASKLASVAREEYLQSENSSKDSGDLPQTSSPAETTQDSNKNLDVLPLFPSQTD